MPGKTKNDLRGGERHRCARLRWRTTRTARSLIATGLAVCCALAASRHAGAQALDVDDPEVAEVAELVQWHSGTSAANDFCGAHEDTLLHARYPRVYAVFLAMHGAPGIPEAEFENSVASPDDPESQEPAH